MLLQKNPIAKAIVEGMRHAGGPGVSIERARAMAACIEMTLEWQRDVSEVIPVMRFGADIGIPMCFHQLGCTVSEALITDIARRVLRLRYRHPRVTVDEKALTLAITKINMWGEKYSGIGTPKTLAAELHRRLPKTTVAKLAKLGRRRIAFLGDSLMTTLHWASHGGYPDILSELLRQINPRVTIINAGIGGHTSVQGLARMDRDVLAHRPDTCLVFFGGNDISQTNNGKNLKPMALFRTSMRAMLDRLKKAGVATVMFNGVRGGIASRKLYEREVVASMERLSKQAKVPCIDVYSAMAKDNGRAWLSLDDIHLNNEGQLGLAALVAEWLVR